MENEWKNLAKQHNNAGGKYVSPITVSSDQKQVPRGATPRNLFSYLDALVQWTAREVDEVSGSSDGFRWDLEAKETVKLLKFLDELTGKTWRECENEMSGGHRRNHEHPVTELSQAAQARLRKFDDGEERVFRFRLSGRRRLWGFRSGKLFRVLWYDPEHRVYPVEKRHT